MVHSKLHGIRLKQSGLRPKSRKRQKAGEQRVERQRKRPPLSLTTDLPCFPSLFPSPPQVSLAWGYKAVLAARFAAGACGVSAMSPQFPRKSCHSRGQSTMPGLQRPYRSKVVVGMLAVPLAQWPYGPASAAQSALTAKRRGRHGAHASKASSAPLLCPPRIL